MSAGAFSFLRVRQCIWRVLKPGVGAEPPTVVRCGVQIDSTNRNAQSCWQHSVAYGYLSPTEKKALRALAAEDTARKDGTAKGATA